MKHGNEALKEVNKLLNIDDIERILDETKEASDKQEVTSIHVHFVTPPIGVLLSPVNVLVLILLLG